MIVIERVRITNYRNLQDIELNGLKDLNILVGPPNCGKSNILAAINKISKCEIKERNSFPCYKCRQIQGEYNIGESKDKIENIHCKVTEDELYRRTNNFNISLWFDKTPVGTHHFIRQLKKVIKNSTKFEMKYKMKLRDHLDNRKHYFNKITLLSEGKTYAIGKHINAFYMRDLIEKVQNITLCQDARLKLYKGKTLREYIIEKNISSHIMQKVIKCIGNITDSRIKGIKQKSLDFERVDDFITNLEEQGSGVRSLICLLVDILSCKNGGVILIDEPELGLNPSGKQAFLKMLIQNSSKNQIIIATHDPTFLNPRFWSDFDKTQSLVFLYSTTVNKFVKVGIEQNKEVPNTFAGYLPHTVCLKKIHIYLEGPLDVYIYQIFLEKYLRKRYPKNWYKIENSIGIYHLGGDFWKHLLYTIPKFPYHPILILDGDKKKVIPDILNKYRKTQKTCYKGLALFQFYRSIDQIKKSLMGNKDIVPVYCLKESNIEEYLIPKPKSKKDGPRIAINMKTVPREIERIFNSIIRSE